MCNPSASQHDRRGRQESPEKLEGSPHLAHMGKQEALPQRREVSTNPELDSDTYQGMYSNTYTLEHTHKHSLTHTHTHKLTIIVT